MDPKEFKEQVEAEFPSPMQQIDAALTQYYAALNRREHGGVAAGLFVDEVQKILGRHRTGDEK